MKVVLASHNAKKITEMRAILSQMGVEVLSQRDVGVDLEPEETGTTFEANARIKAKAVMEATGLPAIADDSGLMVDALDGAPGVYSARYGGPGLDDTGRWQLLLSITQSQICFCTQTIQHRQNQMLTRNSSLITITLLFHNQYICILLFTKTSIKHAVYR